MPKLPAKIPNLKTVTMDAAGIPAGRLATQVVKLLLGKNSVQYTRHWPAINIRIKIEHLDQLRFTGRKLAQKKYYHHTGYMGHLKEQKMGELFGQDPILVFRRIVRGMLPKNKWRDTLLKQISFSK
jgi:large subunit ribosomal protein L13